MISLVGIKNCQKLVVVMVASIWCMLLRVVTRAKDYGSSQPDLGKEPAPLESPLHIEKPVDKPEVAPRIPKGFLKRSRYNPNAKPPKTILLSRIWATLLVRCLHLKHFKVVL